MYQALEISTYPASTGELALNSTAKSWPRSGLSPDLPHEVEVEFEVYAETARGLPCPGRVDLRSSAHKSQNFSRKALAINCQTSTSKRPPILFVQGAAGYAVQRSPGWDWLRVLAVGMGSSGCRGCRTR